MRLFDFPNYETYGDINHVYSDFIGKLTNSIDEVPPIKVIRLKSRSEDWFDGEICNAIKIKNKRLKKFKRLVIDEEQ